ncbi:MAG TPA: hypothetical protein PLE19_15550 [Planctomycetota bacterium]|nr:hypothetical protein [Planctomycetota bacterium]HRR79945.1 hypothetical protein [Planctomycetota bacterium]HRT95368.1 hypothetical protein [Planctomycetota bacterium]
MAAQSFHVDATRGRDGQDGLTPETAWQSLEKVNAAPLRAGDRVLFRRGETWRGQLVPRSGDATGPVTYAAYGEGPKPLLLGSVAMNAPDDWRDQGGGIWATATIRPDVGNLIFDGGKATGVKKWSEKDLTQEGDFLYDRASSRVKLRAAANPATLHKSIELALTRHIIDQSGKGYITYEGLDLRYGAAHGIGGGGTRNIIVRDCDLSYIGGGHQFTRPDGHPVRYGNGIEFWAGARDCLVEGCRLWEIYDAALTNQGSGTNVQENITYRRNVIWNCEYSFEYWNREERSQTRNILFEHNTCVDAGRGWGHRQRPDPNGRHLMFYHNSAATEDFVIRYNVFANATGSCLRLHGRDWTAALTMDRNCWFQAKGALIVWGKETFTPEQFAAYQQRTGKDGGSIVADPKFLKPEERDYRLAADSPARALGGEHGPAGALQ